ncbi:MAG: hypothetical protein FWC40_04475 [Proteobacteria bacterium]|nr:hypothetical protein [Pseudomonadota bacterium]
MNFWHRMGAIAMAAALPLVAISCDNDDVTISTETQWIGALCRCTGTSSDCTVLSIPLPTGKPIEGCDNVPAKDFPAAELVCLTTIDEAYKSVAPPTYFPAGYCSLSAVKCEGSNLCSMVNYGDVDALVACPKGSALLESQFEYKIMNDMVIITNKTCVKNCETDADCNQDGEMSCLSKKGAKFCYHEKNFDFMGGDIKLTVF